jgi:Ca2+-binding RTX toxin-like protein
MVALIVALAATAAFAQGLPPGPDEPGPDNELIGTENSEVLFGTNSFDRIVGLGGHDYLNGLWDSDILEGGQGHDLLVGEAGADDIHGDLGNDYVVAAYGYWQQAPYAPAAPDFIQAGPGHDTIDAADLAGAPDDVRCGPGFDVVYAGVEDNVADSCEVVYRYEGF